jgi:baculoviral IAP repeat-containing protein 6
LYSSKDRERRESEMEEGTGESDDDEIPEDEQLDDMLDQDLNWELEVARRKKRWKAKEEELRSGGKDDANGSLGTVYHDPSIKNRQPKQVFTNAAASGILINDLVNIMETTKETSIVADTVGDNIFQWNVKLAEFSNTALDQDFKHLKEDFDYDYIELQLDFSMDLYPFFPPLVKVIRPRLQGSMMLRVTTMEILKLTYWDPARDMKSVLLDIKTFLSSWARLDLDSDRNDQSRYPTGAYIDIEHHLLRLAVLSEVTPRANKKYLSVLPSPACLPPSAVVCVGDKEEKEVVVGTSKEEKKGKGWMVSPANWLLKGERKKKEEVVVKSQAKGTGYSSYQNKGWDVKAWMAAQKETDKQIQLVLEKICSELKKLHSVTTVQGRNLPDLLVGATSSGTSLPPVEVVEREEGARTGGRRKRKHSPEIVNGPVDPLSDLYAVLEGSALVPFLESKLQANSFLEIGRHCQVYKVIIGIIREMAGQSCLVSLLGSLPDQSVSLHSLLQGLETQARIMVDRIGRASANGSVPKHGKVSVGESEGGDGQMARDFLTLSKDVTQALKNTGYLPDINGLGSARTDSPSPSTSSSPSPVAGPSGGGEREKEGQSEDQIYEAVMAELQFDSIEFDKNHKSGHAFIPEFNKAGNPSSQIIFRVAQEISSLAAPNSLPVTTSSSIFVRSDDEKSTLLKAVITGPEGTPYTGGVYEFDIYFPTKYPAVPPKVTFRTTGSGTVRFNPNLYNEGKVCLSLLGTWEGAQGEQWNAETSTIIQVLISIQSLILCAEPYYNEPGFERNYGTSVGNAESNRYNEEVFKNNLKFAILSQLASPPEGFEEVTKAHFYLRRHSLIKELETQQELYKSKEVKKLVVEVKAELLKLEKPSVVKVAN